MPPRHWGEAKGRKVSCNVLETGLSKTRDEGEVSVFQKPLNPSVQKTGGKKGFKFPRASGSSSGGSGKYRMWWRLGRRGGLVGGGEGVFRERKPPICVWLKS